MNRDRLLWLAVLTIFACLIIPALVQKGMFLDGITYASIANNLSQGIGNFFVPEYTKTLYSQFFEHPPLVFGIQSFLFKLLGDGFYVEKLYSLLTAILTMVGIVKCWELFGQNTSHKNHSWLPVILWLLVPIVTWSYKNNILENTVGVFTTYAVFFITKSYLQRKIKYLPVAGILIYLAFLSKGFVGLFPLAVPLIYHLIYAKKSLLPYFILLVFSSAAFVVISFSIFPDLLENIINYFNQQLIPALENKREVTTSYRLKLILDLLLELSVPLIITLGIFIKTRTYKKKTISFDQKKVLFFLLIGLAASIPLLITLKQRKFYLIPSIPFYCIAIGHLIGPTISVMIESLNDNLFNYIKKGSYVVIAFLMIFCYVNMGNYSRDELLIQDVEKICANIPKGSILSSSKESLSNWNLIAYFSRIGQVSLINDSNSDYLLLPKEIKPSTLERNYQHVDLDLNEYMLLKREP